jgi:glycosyltransferase involved in cell wall biosynthesis
MANRKLLFIAYYLPPMGSSGVQRPYNLLKMFPAIGWDPIVLCPETGMYHTLDHELGHQFEQLNLPVYRVKSKTPFHLLGGDAKPIKPSSETISKVLRWMSAFFFLPDNKRAWIRPAIQQGGRLIREFKPDLILATSPPPSNVMIASKLSREWNIPVVFDMRDDWLDNHQQIYPSRFHKSLMAKLESRVLPYANAIISVNSIIQEAIQTRYPSSKAKFYCIPSGYDPSSFKPTTEPLLQKEKDTLTFLYSGRFYGENQPDIFLKSIASLIKDTPQLRNNVRLAFQGGLDTRQHNLIYDLGLSDIVQDLGYVNHDVAVANLKQADVLWVIAAHSNNGIHVSTGKVTEYFGAGKPIIALAPEDGALSKLISDYGPSYLAEPFLIDQVKKALHVAIKDIVEGNLRPVNTEYVKQFTIESMASSFKAVFDSVVQHR